jgi:hypothetical protein
MATVDNTSLPQQVPFAGEYGNKSVWGPKTPFAQASVGIGDVLRICKIPAGARVDDLKLVFDDCGTSMTIKIGYAPVNSADGPSAVDDYWGTGVDVATAAGAHRSIAHPILFDYDVYVTVTVATAAFTGSPKLSVVASGEYVGTK